MHNLFNVDFNVIGKGFEYRSLFPGGPQVPFAGTVKEVDVTAFGDLAIVLRHMNVSVPKLAKMLEKDDPFLAFPKLLKGDDTVIGSEFDDPALRLQGQRPAVGPAAAMTSSMAARTTTSTTAGLATTTSLTSRARTVSSFRPSSP